MVDFADLTTGRDPLAKTVETPEEKSAPKPMVKRSGASGTWDDKPLPSFSDNIMSSIADNVIGKIGKDNLAAFVKNAGVGGVNQAIGAIPVVGTLARGADAAMMMTGVAEPLIRRGAKGLVGDKAGDVVGDVAAKVGEYAPSNLISDYLAKKVGDPTKGSETSGTLGVIAGINPLGIARSAVKEGTKAAGKEAAKSTVIGLGATQGANGLGGVMADTTDVILKDLLGKDILSEKEREALKNTLGAPLGAATGSGIVKAVSRVGAEAMPAASRVAEVTASGNAEKRIKQVESESSPDRAVDELAVAKNLMARSGMSEQEALSTVKKSVQGTYGDVSKELTRAVDHRIVDSVRSTIEDSIGLEDISNTKDSISQVNNAVRGIDKLSSLLSDSDNTKSDIASAESALDIANKSKSILKVPEKPGVVDVTLPSEPIKPSLTPDEVLKQRTENLDTADSISQALKDTVPSYSAVKDTPEFKTWLRGHDLESIPKTSQDNLAVKFFIKSAIDKYYEKHVDPIKREVMGMDAGIVDPAAFADFVATEAEQLASQGREMGTYRAIHDSLTHMDKIGKLNTVDDIYGFMNNLEKNTHFANNKGAIGKLKEMIIAELPKEVQDGISEFKKAYQPFGSDLKQNTSMYKLATYDPGTHNTVESFADNLSRHAPDESLTTTIMLAKDSPDVAYTALRGLNSKMSDAVETHGVSGMAKVIKEHIERVDALANVLPDNHPAKPALQALQGLLEVSNDAKRIEEALKVSEAQMDKYDREYKQYEAKTRQVAKKIVPYLDSQQKYLDSLEKHELRVQKADRAIEEKTKALESLRQRDEATKKHINELTHYGEYASKSFDSVLSMVQADPGMLAALKAQPIGQPVPLTHDVAKSLLSEVSSVPDLTKQRAALKALSAVQGVQSVIPDLIRHGISQEIARFRADGSLDSTATMKTMKVKRDIIRSYVRNLETLLDTTDGLNPEQVAQSKKYLSNLSDALEVADNDLISRVFHRVYTPSESVSTKGDIEKTFGSDPRKVLHPGRMASGTTRLFGVAADVIAKFFHGKDAIDAAILKKLDDPDFVESVSNLKKGYSKQRAEDVRRQAEESFRGDLPPVSDGLATQAKRVLNAAFPGVSIATGFLGKTRAFGKSVGSNWLEGVPNTMSYQSEQQRLHDRFQQHFETPVQHEEYNPDEDMKAILNWKG